MLSLNKTWLFVLGLIAVICLSYGESPAAQYEDHAKSNPETANVTMSPQSSSYTKTRQYHKPNAEDKLIDWLSNLVDIRATDVIIAIFTVFLATKTGGLYRETYALRQLADEQRVDTLRSIKAAEASAKAAGLAAEAAIASDRPILVINKVQLLLPREEGGSFLSGGANLRPRMQPNISFINFGRTPAQIIFGGIDWSIANQAAQLRKPPEYRYSIPYAPSAVIETGKSVPLDIGCQIDLDSAQLALLNSSAEHLFVYGYIKYRSFFNTEHKSRFCGKWVLAGAGKPQGFVWDSDAPQEYVKNT
jgi:hypothetical protein